MATSRFRVSTGKFRALRKREGTLNGSINRNLDLDMSMHRRFKQNLADPVKGAKIELATRLALDNRRAKRLPITLAGPKFED